MKRIHCSKNSTGLPPRWQHGFTLIELMVVVALVGILGTLATPMFRTLIEGSRIATELTSFQSDLQFARSEAIKQGRPVSICPSSDKAKCLQANTWHVGWIVIQGPDSTGAFSGTPLRIRPDWSGNDTVVANPTVDIVTYNRDGFAAISSGNDITFSFETASLNTAAQRCLTVNRVGQLTASRTAGACP